ncbi:MAG TPA: phospholipase [Thermoanaerobaculia bacterium]
MNRRDLLKLAGAAVLAHCAEQTATPTTDPARLVARPQRRDTSGAAGTFPLHLGVDRDGLLFVPSSYRADRATPLIVMLHGAGGLARRVVDNNRSRAEEFGVIVLAPESRGVTWDVVRGEFGEDIRFMDRALDRVFHDYNIDARHLAIGGFSDGASYALSVGITNGDLFTHIVAFSPGFASPESRHGSPRIFISHGTEDEILPIARASRRVVPALRQAGYAVEYEEFHGPHRVPEEVARHAFQWFIR